MEGRSERLEALILAINYVSKILLTIKNTVHPSSIYSPEIAIETCLLTRENDSFNDALDEFKL